MAGSISRLGKAMGSQCEVEEPVTTGTGALSSAKPAVVAPARTVRLRPSVTLTVPLPIAVLRALPSGRLTRTEGMVIVGSTPAMPAGGLPATLSTTTTAMAPAFWAFLALTTKPQKPRSTTAIFPAMAAALVIGEQPSKAVPPGAGGGGSIGSMACARTPVTPSAVRAGPNCARPTRSGPRPAGALTVSSGAPNARVLGTVAVT